MKGSKGRIIHMFAFCTEAFISRVTHQKSSKCIVIPIVAFCLIYNIPKFFEIRTKVPGENNSTLALEELNSTVLNGKLNLKLPVHFF